MNKLITKARIKTLSAITLIGLTPAAAFADWKDKETEIGAGSGAVIGAIAGGPPGLVIGAMIGSILGETASQSNDLKEAEVAVNYATQEIRELENQIQEMDMVLAGMDADVTELEEALLTRLEFQILFRTGGDQLRTADMERISMLAKYLKRNPDLDVRLEGHTDARGTEEYNNLLAEHRANSVSDALIAMGIEKSRIIVDSKGSADASAKPGDYEGYAMDRRVNIEVGLFEVSTAAANDAGDMAQAQ